MEGLQMRKLTSLLIVTVAFGLATPAGAQTRAHSATTRPGNTPPSANIRGSSGALQKMSPQSIPTNEMQGLRLQSYMDQRSKSFETLSHVIKKMTDPQIIKNMK
jgi:hypothetical protein